MCTSRSLFQISCCGVLLIVTFLCYFNFFKYSITITRFHEIHKFCSHNDAYTCISDIPSILFICKIVVLGTSVLFISLLLNSFIVYLEEAKEKNLPIFCVRLVNCVDYPVYTVIGLPLFICLLITRFMEEDGFHGMVECLILVFGLATFSCFISMIFPYDDVDLSHSVNMKNSIGAAYASGAYKSFYKIVFTRFISCVKEWEEKNDKCVPVKKLVVICPLSCNVEGDLKGNCKSNDLDIVSEITSHIGDQGANMNRKYKHTVYGIKDSQNVTLVIAEYATPLGVLWEQQQQKLSDIENQKLDFIRDCFISTLKKLLKDLPCIVVEYDDRNPSNSLDKFLLSVIEKDLEKSFKVKEV